MSAEPTTHPTSPSENLDSRYGRMPRRRRRLVMVAAAVVGALIVGGWAVWASSGPPAGTVEAVDTGFAVLQDRAVEVRFELTVEPGRRSACAVQALSQQFQVIGWRVVEYPASSERTRAFTEQVRTLDQAVTGLIYRCWLT